MRCPDPRARRSRTPWATVGLTLPVAFLLLLTLLFGASDYLHARLLTLGQSLWPGYGLIHQAVPRPACHPNPDIGALVTERLAQARRPNPQALLPPVPPNRADIRASLRARRTQCRNAFRRYDARQRAQRSWVFRTYSTLEAGVGTLTILGLRTQPDFLVLVIVLCAGMATAARRHIALRGPVTRVDLRTGAALQVAANLLLFASAWAWAGIAQGATRGLTWLWMGGFAGLAALSLLQVVRIPHDTPSGGTLAHALRTVPLYTYLTLVAGAYFLLRERYAAGLMVQILRMVPLSGLYLAVALYIWAGVLLKHTRFTELVFDVLRPWRLAPELITILVVLLAAVPTAFTGASGIFVLALGGVLYDEIRRSGARRSLAMAATAMSGSMGVVLNPCLMIVIISALNRQVTADQLYRSGDLVFLLSASLFCAGVLLTRRGRLTIASLRAAGRPSLRALQPLVPYAVITGSVIVAFSLLLGQRFNAFSAPTILPVILLGLLAWDRRRLRRAAGPAAGVPPPGFWPTVRAATTESTVSIGSLLLLMALSVALGGVIERSGLMDLVPATLGSAATAMAVLVVILVIVGMLIDPYGAIILVSAAIAPIAYRNGIRPVHFWMVVLVAFELGYLMPPVALNHLLARQAIGEEEFVALLAERRAAGGFWRRHEHVLLPILVMGTSLVLVAFVPLIR